MTDAVRYISKQIVNGRSAYARRRLASLEKPTIVKSLLNGKYYCGIHVMQSDKRVAACWHLPQTHATLSRVSYAVGDTPTQAYEKWLDVFRWVAKRLPGPIASRSTNG